jgi:hypothetical protein
MDVKQSLLKNENLCDFLSPQTIRTVESRNVDRIERQQNLEATEKSGDNVNTS